jgi:hypothetical protein
MSQQTLAGTWTFRPRETDMNHRFVVGLLGSGIGRSLTPRLHEAEADRLGLAYTPSANLQKARQRWCGRQPISGSTV